MKHTNVEYVITNFGEKHMFVTKQQLHIFIDKEIAEAFRGDLMHLAKKTLQGAGCKEKNMENTLKKAGYTKKEINFVINKISFKEDKVVA